MVLSSPLGLQVRHASGMDMETTATLPLGFAENIYTATDCNRWLLFNIHEISRVWT